MANMLRDISVTDIAAAASSLWERLSADRLIPVRGEDGGNEAVEEKIELWKKRVGRGSPEMWEKRVRWGGWDMEHIRAALGPVAYKSTDDLPAWTGTMKRLMEEAQRFSVDEAEVSAFGADFEDPLPFEDIFFPATVLGEKMIREKIGKGGLSGFDLLTPHALHDLRNSILAVLSLIGTKVLLEEFAKRRPAGENFLLTMLGGTSSSANGTSGNGQYRAFIRETLEEGYVSLFSKYPVLARLLCDKLDLHTSFLAEFLQRLADDHDVLSEHYGTGAAGLVKSLHIGASDSHHGGRTVIIVEFTSGKKCVYKPKDIRIEAAWGKLLGWCCEQGLSMAYRDLHVIARDGYGWVGFVENEECEDDGAVRRYYRNAGCQLALLYLLGASDFHYENIIACGEYPVLIDLESLLNPQPEAFIAGRDDEELTPGLNDSVMRIGLLPIWMTGDGESWAVDISGLGGTGNAPLNHKYLRVQNINTDKMHMGMEAVEVKGRNNVVTVAGEYVAPYGFIEEIVEGFRATYHFLIDHKEVLTAPEGPLSAFRELPIRHINRATKLYATILTRSISPECLRNGVNRSVELDVMSWTYLPEEMPPIAWPIAGEEVRQVERMDIPFFRTSVDSHTLDVGEGVSVPSFFAKSAWELLGERLARLDDDDMALQIELIRGSFTASVVSETGNLIPVTEEENVGDAKPLTRDELIEEAERIGAELLEREIGKKAGAAMWVGLTYMPQAERFQFQPIDEGMYNGLAGVALFFASLYSITLKEKYRSASLRAIATIRKRASTPDSAFTIRWADTTGISFSSGLGGKVYALTRIANLLGDEMRHTLLEEASVLAGLITPARIEKDEVFDIIGGCAGTILSLLALHHETGNPALIEIARECGEYLLRHQTTSSNGVRTWMTVSRDTPLTGFSHGASGLAYSLLELYHATGEQRFLQSAVDGLAFERTMFIPEKNNWPDLRSIERPAHQEGPWCECRWCHGATGIGFARLGALPILHEDAIRQELEVAMETTERFGIGEVDDLCCGNFGRIDFLLQTGRTLGRNDLIDHAEVLAARLVKRVHRTGRFQVLSDSVDRPFVPGFFKGIAGIGYELLRLAEPANLPSVLMIETEGRSEFADREQEQQV